MASRESFVNVAKLAEKAERHDDTVEAMKNAVKLGPELTVEERDLLSVGYKNALGSRRKSWRILSSSEQREEVKGNERQVELIRDYRQSVESDISSLWFWSFDLVEGREITIATWPRSKSGTRGERLLLSLFKLIRLLLLAQRKICLLHTQVELGWH